MSTRRPPGGGRPPRGGRGRPPRRRSRPPGPTAGERASAIAGNRVVRGVAYWGTVTVAGLLLILWIISGPVLGIGTVTVEGYTGPQKAAVQETAELVAATGSMVRVPVGDMRRALERFPGVVDVRVERDWPRSVMVDVTMGEPVAILAVESGGRYLLSPSGQIMGKAGTTVGLPVISVASPPPGGVLSAPGDRAALLFVGWLQPEVAGRLRNLRFQDGRLFADLANGLELRIGPPTKLAQKAQALAAVLAQADPKALGDAAYLDISNPSRPMLGAKVVPLAEEGSDEESPGTTDTTGTDADGTDAGDGSGDTGTTDDGMG